MPDETLETDTGARRAALIKALTTELRAAPVPPLAMTRQTTVRQAVLHRILSTDAIYPTGRAKPASSGELKGALLQAAIAQAVAGLPDDRLDPKAVQRAQLIRSIQQTVEAQLGSTLDMMMSPAALKHPDLLKGRQDVIDGFINAMRPMAQRQGDASHLLAGVRREAEREPAKWFASPVWNLVDRNTKVDLSDYSSRTVFENARRQLYGQLTRDPAGEDAVLSYYLGVTGNSVGKFVRSPNTDPAAFRAAAVSHGLFDALAIGAEMRSRMAAAGQDPDNAVPRNHTARMRGEALAQIKSGFSKRYGSNEKRWPAPVRSEWANLQQKPYGSLLAESERSIAQRIAPRMKAQMIDEALGISAAPKPKARREQTPGLTS